MIDEDSNLEEPEKEAVTSCDEIQDLAASKNESEKEDDIIEDGGLTKDESEDEEDDHDDDDDDDDSEEEEEENDSLDEEEAESRRIRYVSDMDDLEKQFGDLKEQLYKEQIAQIEGQLRQVKQSEAKAYTGPLKEIEQECIIRTEVAWQLKYYRIKNLENKLQCELQQAEQHFENEERALYDSLANDFEEKLRKVEEERHSSEMYSDLWSDDAFRSRKKRKGGMEMHVPEKRKKPVTVTGPYIIYMLNEMDILEDWAAVRKAKSELARRKAAELSSKDKDPLVTARYEDGKFFYQNEWFQKGDRVTLDNRIDSPVKVTIIGINTGEVWVSKSDGMKCKLYIAQFQRGKFVISRYKPPLEDEII